MLDEYNGPGISCGVSLKLLLYRAYLSHCTPLQTTIIALEFDAGVVIAADSRTSCGNYVWNRLADKLTPITDRIVCCRSGSASQTQALANAVMYIMNTLEYNLGEPVLVYDAAATFRNQIYGSSLQASFIVAGWDRKKGGQVYSIPVSGMLVREHFAISGSGSPFIQGYIMAEYRQGMSLEECIELVQNAVRLAIIYDNASGGVVRVGVITKDGMQTKVFSKMDDEIVEVTNKILWTLEFGKW